MIFIGRGLESKGKKIAVGLFKWAIGRDKDDYHHGAAAGWCHRRQQ